MSPSVESRIDPCNLPDLYEVVDGEIKERPKMGIREMGVATRLLILIANFIEPKHLGLVFPEVLFHLKNGRPQRRPDVAFISAARWPIDEPLPTGDAWSVVPDLTVEVVSPSNTFNELQRKILEYFDAGVRAVWVIATEAQCVQIYDSPKTVRILGIDDCLTGEPVLPGFEVSLRKLFMVNSK